ncbi:nucleotidyltransferase family protein [Microbacterium ulmi]|uniref:Uncharacterized protein n=1 Tax=Microbacterium ulmi TaxID=179095 RepID=A0A7Y2LYP1_9MICO|nr:hypothetical protein [Microbacterium ulmi]NNH03285.1 hypothetical protein [Microbacterium ulmi]
MSDRLRPLARLLVESVTGATGPLPAGVADEAADRVLAAGELHRVRPAIRRRVLAAPDAPPQWRAPLDRAHLDQVLRQLRAGSDVGVIAGILDGAGMAWAVSKGPVLADAVWPHSIMREFADLDVFVHPARFGEALALLESGGFALVDRNWPEIARQNRAELALRGPSGLAIDLHWGTVVTPRARRSFPVDLATLLSRVRPVALATGVCVPAFAPADLLVHVAFHAAQSGANRLAWLGDVLYCALQPDLDWDAVAHVCGTTGMSAGIGLVLARTERVFDRRLPLPGALRREADDTAWARRARGVDVRSPFPGLPGDAALGGTYYSSARSSLPASVAAAVRTSIEVRVIESRVRRRGVERNPLDDDVPDAAARASYLGAIAAGTA